MNRRFYVLFSFLTLLLLLAACSSDSPEPVPTPEPIVEPIDPTPVPPPPVGGNSISGNVIAPAGGDISGTEIGACPIVGDAPDCTNVISVVIAQPGPSAPYNLDVAAGQPYVVFAFKDVNSSGARDDGDYFGAYPSAEAAEAITAPASSINVTMQVFGSGSPTPPTGGGEGTGISGTLSAGAAGDVANTVIAACPVVGGSADCSSAVGVTPITQAGASVAYSLDVPTGSYLILAVQDINGDGTEEFAGAFESSQNLLSVPAPANGINFQLEPAANFASASASSVDTLNSDTLSIKGLGSLLE